MVATQQHRGPDHQHVQVDGKAGVGMGHARLSILDLSHAADQPMSSHDGRFTIVYNGEIYNWRELRADLAERGCGPFKTSSDTEVLLEGYRAFGADLPERLRGMFAFAILDRSENVVFVARDPIGKKPLVYSEWPEGVALASEIPALLCVPGLGQRLNHSALAGMLLHNMRHIPDPETAYQGVSRLRPGHAMFISGGRVTKLWRYWQPRTNLSNTTPEDIRATLEEAVRKRMIADVPVGALLSGGVDSTAIVALMRQQSKGPVRTYALGMDRDDEDLRRARAVADQLGCEHREFYFDADRQFEVFSRLIHTYGEPIALLPLVHTFELCEAIKADGIKVVLAGHGADELFYGYTGHLRTALLTEAMNRLSYLRPLVKLMPASLQRGPLGLFAAPIGARKAALYRAAEADTWAPLIQADKRHELENVVARECAFWGGVLGAKDYIDESNFVALMMENAHSVTTAADLPGMLASVEMRAPFMDRDLVDLAFSLRFREKIPSLRDTSRLKYALKKAVADLVPHDLLYAPKRGFGHGIQERDVLKGAWRDRADEIFEQPSDADGLFDPDALKSLWRAQRDGDERYPWSLVAKLFSIQLWLKTRQ